jgi:hypothetical protein
VKLWKPGDVIVLREVWRGKVYSVIPVRVAQDSPAFTALYLPPRTPCQWPHTREGATIRLRTDEWVLREQVWTVGDVLFLVKPGAGYTFTAFWNEQHVFDHWKVNLEEPMCRTSMEFDYMDQLLDIIISADHSTWRWKDEDELQEAQVRGIFSMEEAREIRAKGEHVITLLQMNQPPFNEGWEDWSPEPAWRTIPELPTGWDIVS